MSVDPAAFVPGCSQEAGWLPVAWSTSTARDIIRASDIGRISDTRAAGAQPGVRAPATATCPDESGRSHARALSRQREREMDAAVARGGQQMRIGFVHTVT